MRRLPLNRVKEMFFIAEPVTAAEAVEWGILNHLVEADRLEDYTYDLARRIATKAPLVLRVVKEQLRILTDASPITSDVFERIEALRESVYQSADYLEGIRAFQQKRPPSFSGN
jgi:methylmalonyl-CoA decarboxylase